MTKNSKPKKIDVFGWMELTRPNKAGISPGDKQKLEAIRAQVFKTANVHPQSLVVAKSRGAIGENLYRAVYGATQYLDEQYRITVSFEDYSQ
jgi:ABC-type taurine transport system substrate-binding protein